MKNTLTYSEILRRPLTQFLFKIAYKIKLFGRYVCTHEWYFVTLNSPRHLIKNKTDLDDITTERVCCICDRIEPKQDDGTFKFLGAYSR